MMEKKEYSYECQCGWQSMTKPDKMRCPECKSFRIDKSEFKQPKMSGMKEETEALAEKHIEKCGGCTGETAPVLIDLFIAGYNAANEWVKCSERLPEANTRVLTHISEDNDLFSIMDSTYRGMNVFTSDGEYLNFVTHWMPLPTPPTT